MALNLKVDEIHGCTFINAHDKGLSPMPIYTVDASSKTNVHIFWLDHVGKKHKATYNGSTVRDFLNTGTHWVLQNCPSREKIHELWST